MSAPRLNIDLTKIQHNVRTLVDRLGVRGISVTGVTKATLGSAAIASAFLRGGVTSLGDSRVENLESMVRAGVPAPMVLIRTPMLSQVERVVAHAGVSLNTEVAVLEGLSAAAERAGKAHGIILMVELGDLREGILPSDVSAIVRRTLALPSLVLEGIGANLACRSGVAPGPCNMAELSAIAASIEATFGIRLRTISAGNSANLSWALGPSNVGRVDNLRLGESLLLGRDPLTRQPIPGLHCGAITLSAEIIEVKLKPSLPWGGSTGQAAFGIPAPAEDRGSIQQALLALGRQDVDPAGLRPPPGVHVLAASSDHLVCDLGETPCPVGDIVTFELDYSALLRAMTSPFVEQVEVDSLGELVVV